MARLREPLQQTPGQRVALAAVGVAMVCLSVPLIFFGGLLLLYPAGMIALTSAMLPGRWPCWRGVVLGLVAAALLIGAVSLALGDAEESCTVPPGGPARCD